MRSASSLLFTGGTALSLSPVITSVGASMSARPGDARPRRERDYLPQHTERLRLAPRRVPCFGQRRHQDALGIAPTAGNCAQPARRRHQHQPVHPIGAFDRDLLGDRATVGEPDDVCPAHTDGVENPDRDVGHFSHRVRYERCRARADARAVERNDPPALEQARVVRPTRHRPGHTVEQQHGVTRPRGLRRDPQPADGQHDGIHRGRLPRGRHALART